MALLHRCRMPGFFAPMVTSELARSPEPRCLDTLWRLVGRPEPAGELLDPRTADAVTLVPGVAEGPLIGGTLSLLSGLMGTPYGPRLERAIFFFEDVEESPAHIERFLVQLREAGELAKAAGFLIGVTRWEVDAAVEARHLPFARVFEEILAPLGKPALYAMPIGHLPSPMTLPIGINARLDASAGRVEILEPAVASRP